MPEYEVIAEAPLPALPPEAAAVAQEADQAANDLVASAAPIGDFSEEALNDVVKELNKMLPRFGVTEAYDVFTADEDQLPVPFVKLLMMVAKAASDAELMDIAADLDALQDDQDLLTLAGKLRTLAESPEFKRFLASDGPQPEAVMEEEVVVETEVPQPVDEELFAARV